MDRCFSVLLSAFCLLPGFAFVVSGGWSGGKYDNDDDMFSVCFMFLFIFQTGDRCGDSL